MTQHSALDENGLPWHGFRRADVGLKDEPGDGDEVTPITRDVGQQPLPAEDSPRKAPHDQLPA